MGDYDSDSLELPPPKIPLERQVTMGGMKQVFTTGVAKDSGKWAVVQQGGNLKITKFLREAWRQMAEPGLSVESATDGGDLWNSFDLDTMFWFHISNPEGNILNLHVNLGGLVAKLASLGIHRENDIYLINDDDEPTDMDNDFEERLQKLFFPPPEKIDDEGNEDPNKVGHAFVSTDVCSTITKSSDLKNS